MEGRKDGCLPGQPAALSWGLYIDKLECSRNRPLSPPKLDSWVDMCELRMWLDHCDKHHSHHCQLSSQSEQIFTHHPRWLIDVHRLCLVPAEPRSRYVALSYVWGLETPFKTLKRNIDHLQQEGSLSEESLSPDDTIALSTAARNDHSALDYGLATMARTVRDAIKVTQQIREKLLWVDSLCIVQDDEEDKLEQISHMGSIYANAYVTMVAAGGTADSGLRGIEGVTPPMVRPSEMPDYLRYRNSQRYYSHSLYSEIKKHHAKLQACLWNSRAWTFQEQVFSRRLLIFGDTDVSWECHCAVWFERMEVVEDQCQDNKEVVAQGFSFRVPPRLSDYARHVSQYNRRALTYPEDALDAFGGILTTLSTAFVGGFVCGLPSMFFDATLLWYNESSLERRYARRRDARTTLLPSWAWSAWGGAICFPDHTSGPDRIRPLVRWKYKANSQERWRSIPSLKHQPPFCIQREIDRLEVSATVGVATRAYHDNEGDLEYTSFPDGPRSHILLAHPPRSFFRALEFQGVNILLAGESGDCVGMLTSCEAVGNSANHVDRCEVVAISESSINGYKAYNILWIERKADIAYRKGVGRILKSAWQIQESERIDLILG